ncbi:MAG: urease accessory protein UreD [Armatimonadota bacterium]|nr:urease accessory protein UreD [Armatimonadota bacterium]MDW8155781.1 urease accessory protein UreD [Armatimonadota bacterium]
MIADLDSCGPLRIIRPFPLEDDRVLLQLVTVGPGLLAGDRYQLEIRVGKGARAVVLQQSATKVHRMAPHQTATQDVRIVVEEGGELEYYPGLGIPYPEAELHQRTEVSLCPTARFGWFEVWATGRDVRGERLAFRRLWVETAIDADGDPVYRDALVLAPGTSPPDRVGMLEGARYVASGFWRWGQGEPVFWEDGGSVLVAGHTAFGDLYLRALARDGLALRQKLAALLGVWRTRWGLVDIPWARCGSAWG